MVAFNIDPSLTMYLEFEDWVSESVLELIEQEIDEYEAVLGVTTTIGKAPSRHPRWMIQEDPTAETPALTWNPSAQQMTSLVKNTSQVFDTFSLLHSLAHSSHHEVSAQAPATIDEAIELLNQEVKNTYPYFELRKIDWQTLFEEALTKKPKTWREFTVWAKKLVAQLGDAHTSVIDHKTGGNRTPYAGKLSDGILTLTEIPPHTAAYAAGVRAGWQLEICTPEFWEETAGATPQQCAEIAARNAMAFAEESARFTASNPRTLEKISWQEEVSVPTAEEVIRIHHREEHTMYVRLSHFIADLGIEEKIEKLCLESSQEDLLILDLRNNTGGNIMLASALRSMFLQEKTLLGYSSFTTGRGELCELRSRWAKPHPRARWKGQLTVLVNSLTYSASEDFLLGLQGLDGVKILGTTTGGGSGRPRSLPLGPDLTLRISTAITYDRNRCPVEYRGIEPDGAVTDETDRLLTDPETLL